MRVVISFPVALAACALGRPVSACGVSGPDCASGCSIADHDESGRAYYHIGVGGIYATTALRFSGDSRGDQTRVATLVSLAYAPTRRLDLRIGFGAFGGELDMPAGRYVFAPGPTAMLGASWRAIEGTTFLSLSADLSLVAATTELSGTSGEMTGYEAVDLRGGVAFGTTVLDVLKPYAVARAFGGPVFWRYLGAPVMGTDVSHYQMGAGLALVAARRVDVVLEGIPLGERALAGNVALAF